MGHDDPLMMGMFWGGLLVASVPILLTVGVGIYVLKRMRAEGGKRSPEPRLSTDEAEPERQGG
jgi:hypothetical protein